MKKKKSRKVINCQHKWIRKEKKRNRNGWRCRPHLRYLSMEATFSSHRAHPFSITIALQFRTSKSTCVSHTNISVFTPILFMLAAERFLINGKKKKWSHTHCCICSNKYCSVGFYNFFCFMFGCWKKMKKQGIKNLRVICNS